MNHPSQESEGKKEKGGEITVERALALYASASDWLKKRVGKTCACGACHLCAYNFFADQRRRIGEELEKMKILSQKNEHHHTGYISRGYNAALTDAKKMVEEATPQQGKGEK